MGLPGFNVPGVRSFSGLTRLENDDLNEKKRGTKKKKKKKKKKKTLNPTQLLLAQLLRFV